MHRRWLAGLALVAAMLPTAAGARQAEGFATYHVHHVYLTPVRAYMVKSIDYSTPDPGTGYLVITCMERNGDDVRTELDPSEFKFDTEGQVFDGGNVFGGHQLADVVLDPGAHATGDIIFQVPTSSHQGTLLWEPTTFNSDLKYPTYTWSMRY